MKTESGEDYTLEQLKFGLSHWRNVDEGGNVVRVRITRSGLFEGLVLQMYSDAPKLENDVKLRERAWWKI